MQQKQQKAQQHETAKATNDCYKHQPINPFGLTH
jgi:hypothetical protein